MSIRSSPVTRVSGVLAASPRTVPKAACPFFPASAAPARNLLYQSATFSLTLVLASSRTFMVISPIGEITMKVRDEASTSVKEKVADWYSRFRAGAAEAGKKGQAALGTVLGDAANTPETLVTGDDRIDIPLHQ